MSLEERFKQKFSKRLQEKYAPPTLSPKQRKAQIKSILAKKDRPPLPKGKTRRSKWTVMAEKYFGKDRSKEAISKKTGIPVKALKEIVERGEGAYYSAGSRPGQTPESWGIARMYAVLFGSPGARRVDGDIVKKYKIPILGEKKGGGVKEVAEITERKEYPDNYPKDAIAVVNAMSFNGGKTTTILGTMSIRSMLYASDYDCIETVDRRSPKIIAKEYQALVRKLLNRPRTYIGDIKCGDMEDWRIIDDTAYYQDGKAWGYNRDKSIAKVKELYSKKILTKTEYDDSLRVLVPDPSPQELRTIIKMLRFSVLRWKPQDVLNGYLVLRNGEKLPLETAIQQKALFKMDVIALMDNGIYQEFSMIYDLRINGRRLNLFPVNTLKSIKQDIVFYSYERNWFKVLKRIFSYYNYKFKYVYSGKYEAVDIIEKIFPLLNSDLGILYSVSQDIEVLSYIVENIKKVPTNQIKKEVEDFVERLSNVYSVSPYLNQEPVILAKIHQIVTARSNPAELHKDLEALDERVSRILSQATFQKLKEHKLLPIVQSFLRG